MLGAGRRSDLDRAALYCNFAVALERRDGFPYLGEIGIRRLQYGTRRWDYGLRSLPIGYKLCLDMGVRVERLGEVEVSLRS